MTRSDENIGEQLVDAFKEKTLKENPNNIPGHEYAYVAGAVGFILSDLALLHPQVRKYLKNRLDMIRSEEGKTA